MTLAATVIAAFSVGCGGGGNSGGAGGHMSSNSGAVTSSSASGAAESSSGATQSSSSSSSSPPTSASSASSSSSASNSSSASSSSSATNNVGYHIRSTYAEQAPFYLAHSYYHAMITTLEDRANSQLPADFQWKAVPGLANPEDPALVSFEAMGYPGRYLHIDSANPNRYPQQTEPANRASGLFLTPTQDRGYLVWLDPFTNTSTFRSDATFRRVSARNGDTTMASLQWYTDTTRYLWQTNYQIHAHVLDGTTQDDSSASFVLEPLGYLIPKHADPQIMRHTDGYYYFTATVPEYDRIEVRRAPTILGLANATPKVVWSKHATGAMATYIWAPEMHFIDGKWYIYFAAGSSTNAWAIRMYVLENASANPLEGTWTERGQIATTADTFSLDATTFENNGTRYLVWAQLDPTITTKNSSLFIAAMANPWTLTGPNVRISQPDQAWEQVGYAVNEGPAVLAKNGRVFISYSASATDANYCLGLLTANATDDLLMASSWTKSPTPVFASGNGLYGPGHNSFTTSADGSIDVLVYHARNYTTIVGDPLNDPNRHTHVQRLEWTDGMPNFGLPLLNGSTTIGE